MGRCAAIMVLVLLVSAPARANLTPGSPVFVVNLSDPDKGFTVVSARTFNDAVGVGAAGDWSADPFVRRALDAGRDPNPALDIKPASPLERVLGACRSRPGQRGVSAEVKPLVTRLYTCVGCFDAYREKRFYTKAGDQAVLIVLYDANQIDPDQIRPAFREAPRQSELVATARALAGLFRQETQPAPEPACESFVYTMQRTRSTFTVSLAVPPTRGEETTSVTDDRRSAPGGLIDPPTAAAATDPRVLRSPEVILGPAEHWLFSADFSIASTSVHLGETPTADEEKLKNNDFFVALNFAVSDLLPDRDARLQRRSIFHELLLKFQVTPSKKPWEAWAVGVGLRGYRIRTILWNLDVVHPYFTVGRQSTDEGVRWRTVAGLGFDPRSLAK